MCQTKNLLRLSDCPQLGSVKYFAAELSMPKQISARGVEVFFLAVYSPYVLERALLPIGNLLWRNLRMVFFESPNNFVVSSVSKSFRILSIKSILKLRSYLSFSESQVSARRIIFAASVNSPFAIVLSISSTVSKIGRLRYSCKKRAAQTEVHFPGSTRFHNIIADWIGCLQR